MEPGYVIERPNREKPASRAMRAFVVFLLLLSSALMLLIILGGWSALQSGPGLQLLYVVVYLGMAYYVTRWNRGPLPVAAALAIILGIFAAVAAPGWFARDKDGFATPETIFGTTGFDAQALGVMTYLLIPVQVALIVASLQAFRQDWHVEVERPVGAPDGAAGLREPLRGAA